MSWRTVPLRQLVTPNNRRNRPDLPLLSVVRDKGVTKRKLDKSDNHNIIPEDLSNYKVVSEGQFVINKMKAWQGSCGVSPYDGIVSPAYFVFDLNIENPRFFNYAIRSRAYVDEFGRISKGIRVDQWDLDLGHLKKIRFPLPPRDEQDQIVCYLDWKVSRINKLINAKRQQIELLGEYIAVMVQNVLQGSTVKFSTLSKCTTKIGSGKTPRGGATVYVESGVLFIRSQNVYPSGLVADKAYYITNEIDESMENTRVFRNDVLLNITGGSIGRSCVYNMDNHANVNQHVCIIRPNMNLVLPDFLAYFLNSPLGQDMISSSQNEGNRQSLTFVQIGAFKVPLPSIDDQKRILYAIQEKAKPLEGIISKLNDESTLLSEYRTCLISDVVTGKLDVRGVAVPNYEVVEDSAKDGDIDDAGEMEED